MPNTTLREQPTILHVGPLPPPLGGVSVMTQALLRSRPLQKYQNVCFDISRGTRWEQVGHKSLGIERTLRRIRLAIELLTKVRTVHPDVVHFQCGSGGLWDFLGDMLLLLVSRVTRAKLVFHWHRDPSKATYPGNHWLTRWIFYQSAGKSDAITVLTEDYRHSLNQVFPDLRIDVIPNIIESDLLALPVHKAPSEQFHIINMGRLTKEKGIFDLFEIASRLIKSGYNVHFYLAGSPNPHEGGISALKSAISELGIEPYIHFVGSVEGSAKLELFYLADVLLIPSYRESFGIVALEGMAAGVPVIGTNVGVLPDLIGDGVAGYTMEPGDIDGMVEKLSYLIDNSQLRHTMGTSGRERASKNYHIDIVAEKVCNIYDSFLSH